MSVQATLYRAFLALAWLAASLPRRLTLGMADMFAAGLYAVYRLTPYRGFIASNLRGAFPQAEADWLNDVSRAHVQQLSRSIAELLRFGRLGAREFEGRVDFVGWEHLEAARARGRGVILVTAHFGNWELLGAALVARGVPLHALAQPPSQEAFGRLFELFRARVGVNSLPNAGAGSLRTILRALARNEVVVLLADQHGETQDAIVPLFGHPVSAPAGPFFFAQRAGAAVLPIFDTREADGRHTLRIEPELPVTSDVQADAARLYAAYERAIRLRPDHWLWVHDRWAREHELRAVTTPASVGS